MQLLKTKKNIHSYDFGFFAWSKSQIGCLTQSKQLNFTTNSPDFHDDIFKKIIIKKITS